jgi:hypothetical protein
VSEAERRGRAAYEQYTAEMSLDARRTWTAWPSLPPQTRALWERVAAAAFKECRTFEQQRADDRA